MLKESARHNHSHLIVYFDTPLYHHHHDIMTMVSMVDTKQTKVWVHVCSKSQQDTLIHTWLFIWVLHSYPITTISISIIVILVDTKQNI